jgi:hypothetical protein
LDEHVGTITVVRSLEIHLIVVAALRCGHVIKLDLHWLSPSQANALPFSRVGAAKPAPRFYTMSMRRDCFIGFMGSTAQLLVMPLT